MSVAEEPEVTVAPPFKRAEPWNEDACCTEPEPSTVNTADPTREAGRDVLEVAVIATGVIMISWTWALAPPEFWRFRERELLVMVPETCRLGLV